MNPPKRKRKMRKIKKMKLRKAYQNGGELIECFPIDCLIDVFSRIDDPSCALMRLFDFFLRQMKRIMPLE